MNNDEIDLEKLKDIEALKSMLVLYNEAKAYLEKYIWCKNVVNGWFEVELSIYDKIGVFLFEIEPANEFVDDFVWVITGDLPTVYLDKSIKTGNEALDVYCKLMSEWSTNVIERKSINECYPVEAEPTIENAELLKKRVAFI